MYYGWNFTTKKMFHLLWCIVLISRLECMFAETQMPIENGILTEVDAFVKRDAPVERNLSEYYKSNSDVLMAVCEQEFGQIYRLCGGTLIDNVWLVTSQTCRTTKPLDNLLIAVFESIFDRQVESSLNERYLEKWMAHQNYDFSPKIVKNDVALLRLEDIYYHSRKRKVVLLPTKRLFEENFDKSNSTAKPRCTFTFWPLETFDWHKHLRYIYLRQAVVEIIPRNVCSTIVADKVISSEQFCAKFAPGEPIPDKISTGPLLCFNLQFGIYTTKTVDRSGKLILIFTRLDYFQDYIEGITRISAYTDSFPKVETRSIEESIDDFDLGMAITVRIACAAKYVFIFITVFVVINVVN